MLEPGATNNLLEELSGSRGKRAGIWTVDVLGWDPSSGLKSKGEVLSIKGLG